MSSGAKFLEAVLGPEGAAAFRRAFERAPQLEAVVVPRAVLAWAQFMGRVGYDGGVPGLEGATCDLSKSDDGFYGHLTVNSDRHEFRGADVFSVASALHAALGEPLELPEDLGPDLTRLGRSVDLLVRATMAKSLHSRVEVPGPPARPLEPTPPQAPDPTADRTPARKPKLPRRSAVLRMAKSQLGCRCGTCGMRMFDGEKFKGCMCFRAVAREVTVLVKGEQVELSVGWDPEDVAVLAESLGLTDA